MQWGGEEEQATERAIGVKDPKNWQDLVERLFEKTVSVQCPCVY